MPQYVQEIEDDRGDIVERRFYCRHCAPDDILPWPCYESTDTPEYCHFCGEPVGNALTDEGMRYLHNVLVDLDDMGDLGEVIERIERLTREYGDDARFSHRYTVSTGMPGYLPNTADWHRGSRNAAEAAHDAIERDAEQREDTGQVPTVETIRAELEADTEYRFEFPDSAEVLTVERT